MIDALRPASSQRLRARPIVAQPPPRGPLLATLWLLFCLSYLFVPLDVIPDRLRYVGHLDEAIAALLGLLGAWRLARPQQASAGLALRRVRALAGRVGAGVFAGALTRPVLRLMLGRWPERQEVQHFRRGLRHSSAGLPPLLRAIAHVPAARGLVNRTMLLAAASPATAASDARIVVSGQAPMMGDPMRIWRGPKIGYLHLEKTAGSSLTTFLAGLFHPLQIDADPNRTLAPDTRLVTGRGGHRPDPEQALAWGHYDLSTLEALGPDRFLLTVLRDPAPRILSLYHYFRANCGDGERRVRIAHELDLLDYLRSPEPDAVNMIDNLYVRRLTGLYLDADGHDRLAADPDAALAAACAALDRLDFVGLAEDLDSTLAALGRRLGFTPPAHAPRANVLARNESNPFLPFRAVARTAVTPAIAAELERLTRLDRVIYERGRGRFEAPGARD